jgi:vacuolar-type H+-ATPase subunit C/Vma6
MSATAGLAYGNARVRARKSHLVSPAVLVALGAADRPELTIDLWRDIESDADAVSLIALAYARLTDDYDAVIRAYPTGATVLRALARLHELENVKVAWRAAVYGVEPARWQSLWRPMGPLETVSRSSCTSVSSLPQLAAALSGTPFEGIAGVALRAHPADLAAAEMAFDHWGSRTLVTAADALPRREHAARDLVRDVVCERDVAVLERAVGPLGVAAQVAIRMTPTLGGLLGAAAVPLLAEWSGGTGRPLAMPRRLSSDRRPVRTFVELRRAIRVARRAACRRVFWGDPFSLAPAIALVLLREDEVRALISIGELRARHRSTAEAARVLDFDG